METNVMERTERISVCSHYSRSKIFCVTSSPSAPPPPALLAPSFRPAGPRLNVERIVGSILVVPVHDCSPPSTSGVLIFHTIYEDPRDCLRGIEKQRKNGRVDGVSKRTGSHRE